MNLWLKDVGSKVKLLAEVNIAPQHLRIPCFAMPSELTLRKKPTFSISPPMVGIYMFLKHFLFSCVMEVARIYGPHRCSELGQSDDAIYIVKTQNQAFTGTYR